MIWLLAALVSGFSSAAPLALPSASRAAANSPSVSTSTFVSPSVSTAAVVPPSGLTAVMVSLSASTAAFVSPSTATYAAVSGIVGEIRVHRLNVFDPSVPGEDWWGFQMANKIHIPTKEYVLRREILMNPGDRWDPLLAIESERNLRSTDFIRSAELHPSPTSDGKVNLDLYSQDAWTLIPQISVGTEGGQNYLTYGVSESNLLGYGKEASIIHGDITGIGSDQRTEYRYHDPRVWGSRVDATGIYTTGNYGDQTGVLAERPFFSLDTPYGWRVFWANTIQDDILYQDANETTDFLQNFRSVTSSYGLKVGSSEDFVHRVFVGTNYEKDTYQPSPSTVSGTVPTSGRQLSGPTIGYQFIQADYVKETYINSMQRVEDFNLGNELSATAGAMLQSWGSDVDRWTLNAVNQQGLSLGDGKFILAQVGVQGRLHHNQIEDSIFYGNLNVIYKSVWPWTQTWVAHAEANVTKNLDPENQLILGGNTGLRGYESYAFTGTRSALVNLEDRLFLVRQFLHLYYVGGVAFYEMGAITPQGSGGYKWNEVKSDVGIGLRFSPTRSTTGTVIRMDVAYALNNGPGPSRWVVGIRGGQAFNIFNSTNREVLQNPGTAISSDNSGSTLRRRQ